MTVVTYLQNPQTGLTTFQVGDEVETDSIRFFIGMINDSQELCFVDKTKPWTVKDQTDPMVKCMSQGNFGITSRLLKHVDKNLKSEGSMKPEEIIKIAIEATKDNKTQIPICFKSKFLLTFAALVAAKEREACALIGDGYHDDEANCGDVIRARGEQA